MQFEKEHFTPDIQAKAESMNIDPAKADIHNLPVLPLPGGCTASRFQNQERRKLVQACADHMYGELPPNCQELSASITAEGTAFDGLALRREITITCKNNGHSRQFFLLLYIPTQRSNTQAPVFLGLNFQGNHATTEDPDVTYHPYTPFPPRKYARENDSRADESARGAKKDRWCFEKVLQAGYASATVHFQDICADRFDMVADSIYPLFYTPEQWCSPNRSFGAISAWAWGISRIIDVLEQQPELDRNAIYLHGHSRLGKTALWAAANDLRIAAVIANGSGCCGAKLSHRTFGENFAWIQQWNSHWMRGSFNQYVNHDCEYPIDQHFLLAALAPRPVLISEGTLDDYADPIGSFEACRAASPAWELFGCDGLANATFPQPYHRIGKELSYYIRKGDHAVTPDVWDSILQFVASNFQRSPFEIQQ